MANMNDKNLAVAGQRSINDDGRPAFSRCETTRAAAWFTGGDYDKERSTVPELEQAARAGRNLTFASGEDKLNVVVVSGGSYELDHAKLELSGWGCSDFSCRGTGVLAMDGAEVTLKNAEITTRGATRCATIATTGATLKVYDSKLSTYGGPLPPDYVPVIGPGMMEPPAPLGLGGNCRTHLSMDGSRTYFYNCDIYAAAWGAVSTDASGGWLYCEVNDSRVHVEGNGYVTYADNGCHVVFNRCNVSSGNVVVIQDGNSSLTFNDTTARCEGYGMLLHGGMENLADIGLVRWNGGKLSTKNQCMLCKSTNVDIYFQGAKLHSDLGVLMEARLTDDRMYFTRRTAGPAQYGVQATFEDMELEGDFLMGDPERPQKLNLVKTSLVGAIAGNPQLALYEGSTWTAAADSLVTLAGPVDLAQLDARERCKITAHAGEGCALAAGEYDLPSGGKLIVL